MTIEHHLLGNADTKSHGIIWKSVASAIALAALVIVQEDIDQQKVVLQIDTAQRFVPMTLGANATFRSFVMDNDPRLAAVDIMYFGDGSDGDFVMPASGTVTLTTEKYYHNFSWPVGSIAVLAFPTNGAVPAYPLRCSGVLDLTNCPVGGIVGNGVAGGNSAGITGGLLGGTRTFSDNQTIGAAVAGLAGGAGGTAAGGNAVAGSAITFALGGQGGTSAAGGTGNGGASAGGLSKTGGTVTLGRLPRYAPTPEQLNCGNSLASICLRQLQGGASGASGAGGGGDGTAGGGGGGSGGGAPVMGIYAKNLILNVVSTPASAIQAKGAKGGNAGSSGAGNRGGGSAAAGSGGGVIILVYEGLSGSAANFCDASGGDSGTPGTGAGNGQGADGSQGGWGGKIGIYSIGIGLVASATGTGAGINGGAHAGTAPGTPGLGEVTRLGL